MYLQLLIVFVLACAVNARDCLSPQEMSNFDMNKFQGDWYELAFTTANKTDEEEHKDFACASLGFTFNSDHYEVKVNYTHKGNLVHDIGKFTPADTTKALFQMNFPQSPEYNTYVYRVVCTDYDNYAVVYSSQQYEAGHCSEYEAVLVRHGAKDGDIVNSDNVKNCLQNKLQTSIDQIKTIPQNNC